MSQPCLPVGPSVLPGLSPGCLSVRPCTGAVPSSGQGTVTARHPAEVMPYVPACCAYGRLSRFMTGAGSAGSAAGAATHPRHTQPAAPGVGPAPPGPGGSGGAGPALSL